MEHTLRVGIVGYGHLGKGVQCAIRQNPDMTLVAIFSRRPLSAQDVGDASVLVLPLSEAEAYQDKIDVMILCGGSAHDLPEQGPHFAQWFNTVDSYDTHAKIPEYYASVDAVAQKSAKTSLISIGWDPGLFSLNRLFGEAILPEGETYTFWGKGLSQGHSDAIRRVEGVKAGVQYTLPSEAAITAVRQGLNPELSTRDKHTRECYVVADAGADTAKIEQAIKTMPNYFADYDTTVTFISEDTLKQAHAAMPHGGFVIRSGKTGQGTTQIMEYALKLGSNPEFTSSVLVAYARAACKMNALGLIGAQTAFDVAPGWLSPKSAAALRKALL